MTTHLIHLSDTHFGPERSFTVRGAPVLERSLQLVKEIKALPFVPDAIIHTGDVVNDPDHGAYKIAEEVFSELSVPIYYVTGNHDDVPMMHEHLTFGPYESLLPETEERLCYQFEKNGFTSVILDGKVPPEEGPHGFLPENQLEALRSAISGTDNPFGVFIHFPARPMGSEWIDDNLLIRNGEDLHKILKSHAGGRLRGIFTGHLHRGLQIYDEGILYSGVASPACQFSAGPDDDFCDFLPNVPVCFNHISITDSGLTQVKEYTFNAAE